MSSVIKMTSLGTVVILQDIVCLLDRYFLEQWYEKNFCSIFGFFSLIFYVHIKSM